MQRSKSQRNLKRYGKAGLDDQLDDFTAGANMCAECIAGIFREVPKLQVFPDVIPGTLRKELPKTAPEVPEPLTQILDDYKRLIIPKTLHWLHPHFFAYFPGGNSFPNVIGDMLSGTIGGNGFSWVAQPSLTELENIMLDWLSDALNLPDSFSHIKSKGIGGGVIQNTASDAIFSTIIAARQLALFKLGVYSRDSMGNLIINKHPGPTLAKLVCYVNQEAHSCVVKGARVALCTIRVLVPNERDSITGAILEKQIEEDVKRNLTPFYCCATVGTTGGCAFDDLKTIAPVCQKYKMWLHIDGSYGGNSFICPEFRYLKEGIEVADSMTVNPYKFLLGAVDCCCMYLKNVKRYKQAWQMNATYFHDGFTSDPKHSPAEIDYRHYGLATSRRMRSLKLFCLFRYYGISGLQHYVRNTCMCAKHLAELVKKDKRFEISNGEPVLGCVCFRQKPNTRREAEAGPSERITLTDKQNLTLLKRVNNSRKIHLVPSTLKKHFVLRISVNYEHSTIEMMNYTWNVIQTRYVTSLDTATRGLSADEIYITSKLSYLQPVSNKAYANYLKNRSTSIPLTFGPIIVPGEDKHISRMLSMETKTPFSASSKKHMKVERNESRAVILPSSNDEYEDDDYEETEGATANYSGWDNGAEENDYYL